MSSLLRSAALGMVVLEVGAACGSGARTATYDEAAFCGRWVAAYCGCCGDDCGARPEAECADRFFTPVRDGIATVHAGHAEECMSGFERVADDCDARTTIETRACDHMLVGVLPIGTTCADTRTCETGAVCIDGTCRDEGELGEDCVPFSCAEGLYCNLEENQCRAPRERGRGCQPSEEPQCEPLLRCVDSRCMDGLPQAAPCTNDAQCKSLDCDATSRCAAETPRSVCDDA